MYPVVSEKTNFFINEDGYMMECPNGSCYLLSDELYLAMEMLDGKHKLPIQNMDDDEMEKLLETLGELGAIRNTHFRTDGWYTMFSLFFFEKEQFLKRQRICKKISNFLFYGTIPISLLIATIACIKNPVESITMDFKWVIYWAIILLSSVTHEVAHAIAAIASTGCSVTEVGVTMLKFIPIGAYVSIEIEELDTPLLDKLKIHSAGIQADILLSSILFLMSRYTGYKETIEIGAMMTIIMVISNLLPMPSYKLDGYYIVNTLREMKRKREKV